jgi:hypothetical protein
MCRAVGACPATGVQGQGRGVEWRDARRRRIDCFCLQLFGGRVLRGPPGPSSIAWPGCLDTCMGVKVSGQTQCAPMNRAHGCCHELGGGVSGARC